MWRCCTALDPPHREETTSLKWWENIPPKENLIESDLVNCHIWKVENSDATAHFLTTLSYARTFADHATRKVSRLRRARTT